MIGRPADGRRAMAGALVYVSLCVVLASLAWMAAGSVAAGGPGRSGGGRTNQAPQSHAVETGAAASWPADWPTGLGTPGYSTTTGPTVGATTSPFQMDVYRPNTFVSQINHYTCMAAALQNILNIIGPKIDTSTARQIEISTLLTKNTTKDDSKNGGYGPLGWAITLKQLGAGTYKLLIDDTMDRALTDAAIALRKTGRPVGLLTWWGAHSWVMTGFESDGDPRYFPKTFHVNGAFIVDPFYPRISSIWGQTIGPDIFRDYYAMQHNYIGWKRPEGHYPSRDGKFLLVIPI